MSGPNRLSQIHALKKENTLVDWTSQEDLHVTILRIQIALFKGKLVKPKKECQRSRE